MSLIGLTGAHGTGKSTIIKEVKDFGVRVVESSLSRAAQKKLGWDNLSRVEDSFDAMREFQDEILGAMYERDQDILGSFHFTLVDRTPADVWAYVELWTHRFKERGEEVDEVWLRWFKGLCRQMASRYAQQIIVPISEAVPFVAEPGRADLESRDFHEKSVCQFIITGGLPHTVLLQTGISERAKKVAILVNTLQNHMQSFQQIEA